MEINVSGRKMNVGDALTEHVEGRLESISDKYFSRSIDASATFSKEGHLYRSDITFHANQGIQLQSRGEADDVYAAFETAAEKVEKQLRRYKRRLKNHHQAASRNEIDSELARHAVFAPEQDLIDETVETDTSQANGADPQPIIIAETSRTIPRVSVGDAVMLMDLSDTTTFMFRNSKTESLEVVYRRPDGNIGWISPGKDQ